MVGFDPIEDQLKQYVQLKQIKNVSFIGRINYNCLHQYYQRAQAFICTSLNESYGFTLLESMACGTPIIYPKCDIFDKLYKHDFSQLEYFIENDQQFVNVLNYIEINGQKLRQTCRTYTNQYSWRKLTDDLICIYKKIINQNQFNCI